MILDYNPANGVYFLRVTRDEQLVQQLMLEYGLNFSLSDSSLREAVLFTRDTYCAAAFFEHGTAVARQQLGWVANAMASSSALDSHGHFDMPADRELMGFQRADVEYILSRRHALDGDAPGLGKTPTSVVVSNTMQARRNLVICPASLRRQWQRRIIEWSTIPGLETYPILKQGDGSSNSAHWVITSFEMARNPHILRGLVKQRFDLLVVDEAHYAKEISSARSRAIFGYHDGRIDDGESVEVVTECLMNVCEKTLTLTGTPLPNRPSEAYVLCRNLAWESIDFMSEKRFRERFNPQSKGKTSTGKVWAKEEQGRLPELQVRMRSYFMCRHTMPQVRHQLAAQFPDPVFDLIHVEKTKAVKAALEKEKLLELDPDLAMGEKFRIDGAISTARLEMGMAMAPQAADYVQMLLEGGETKLVLFTWHQAVTDYIVNELAPWGVVWTDGRNTSQKDAVVQRFVRDPAVNVLIGNILTLGTGTDGIQEVASHCLFPECDWVPGNNMQAVDRLARFGQLGYVRADFFVAPGSMAEKILGTAIRKAGHIHRALDLRPSEIAA